MTQAVNEPTILRAIITVAKDSGVVAGRVFRMEAVPSSTKITYPYVAVASLGDAAPNLVGDSNDVQEWREQFQVDLYYKKGPIDPALRRTLVSAFKNKKVTVASGAVRFRVMGLIAMPSDDPNDVTTRDTVTVAAFYPQSSM